MSVVVLSCVGRSAVVGGAVEVLMSEELLEAGQVPLPRLGETVEVVEAGRTLLAGVWLGLVSTAVQAGSLEVAVVACGVVVRQWVATALLDCRQVVTGRLEGDDAVLLALLGEIRERRAEQDARTAWLERLVSDAHEEANDRDWCSDFDDFMERAGLPRRERDYEVRVEVTATVYMTRTATSEEDAHEGIDRSDVWDALDADAIDWTVDRDY